MCIFVAAVYRVQNIQAFDNAHTSVTGFLLLMIWLMYLGIGYLYLEI